MSNKNMDTKLSVNFTKASTKQNITSGENISTSFGKISKYLDDLGSAAFTDSSDYATLTALGNKVDKVTGKELMPSDLLDANGNIALSHLPDIVLGQMIYGGTVNASNVAALSSNAKTKLGTTSNTITLTNNTASITGYVANEGIYYIATGNATLANLGIKTGDWLLSTGSAWKKIDNTDEVSSVNGKTGAVTLNASDVSAVSTSANQGLTDTEKANARTNIGAGTSSFDGNYNSLSNKPTIPTINNGTLTIQQNGTTKATFTANQAGNATANLTDTTYSAGDTMTLDNTTFDIGKRWTAVSRGQTWSRLFYINPKYNYIGTSGILSISAMRTNVVVNATFLITSNSGNSQWCNIIELGSANYNSIKVRCVTDKRGKYYFEIYDTNRSISVGTEQSWNCRYIPILESSITMYSEFVDGTTIPSDWVSDNEFTTTVGSEAAAIKNITRSGNTFTATRQDGSTFTFDQNGDFLTLTDVTTTETSDTTPYLYKSSEHDAVYDELVGGSVAWNQLVQNGNFESTSRWNGRYSTISVSNNVCTVTPSSDGTFRGLIGIDTITDTTIAGHKYLISVDVLSPVAANIALSMEGIEAQFVYVPINAWRRCTCIWTNTSSTRRRIYALLVDNVTTSQTIMYKNVYTIDLTQMFGSTIADYAYNLEQSTAGSGIAWLKSYGFFTEDYYAYNAGGLVSVNTSGKKVVGKNLLRKLFSTQTKSNVTLTANSDGTLSFDGTASSLEYFSINFNLAAGAYTFTTGIDETFSTYDTYLSLAGTTLARGGNGASNNFTLERESELQITFRIRQGISLNGLILYPMIRRADVTDSSFEPYTSITYPIQSTDLRGLYKLNGNKLYTDGDIYSADGTVTRKYGIVDLGTLDWVYEKIAGGRYGFRVYISSLKYATSGIPTLLCGKYIAYPLNLIYAITSTLTGVTTASNTPNLIVFDSSYTNAATFKTAMSGVYLIYELATPTTETAQPFASPQMVYRNGTEEYLDTRDVPIRVGGNRKYVDIPDWMVNEYFDDVRAVSDKQQAQIDKVLEQTGYNLIEITAGTRTVNGVTFTVDKVAGTITANGTATMLTAIPISEQLSDVLQVGSSYYMTGCPVGGAYYSKYALYVTLDNSTVWRDEGSGGQYSVPQSGTLSSLYLLIRSGVTVSNLVFKPMIVPSELAGVPFQPYAMSNAELTQKALIPQGDYNTISVDGGLNFETTDQTTLEVTNGNVVIESNKTKASGGDVNTYIIVNDRGHTGEYAFTPDGLKAYIPTTPDEDSRVSIFTLIPQADINHNGIFRGENLTNVWVENGKIKESLYTKVHSGDFSGLYLGDYFTVSITTDIYTKFTGSSFVSGTTYYTLGGEYPNWDYTATTDTAPTGGKIYFTKQTVTENVDLMIAAFDYYYNTGDTPLTSHHLVLIPRNCGFETIAKMNSTNTTTGSYYNCEMHQFTLPCYGASLRIALNNHTLAHRTRLPNAIDASIPSMAGAGMTGASNAWAWYTTELQLMNEVQIYGTTVGSSSMYDVGIDCKKLPVFDFINGAQYQQGGTWLRSVVNSTVFAYFAYQGTASANGASGNGYVRPLILFG